MVANGQGAVDINAYFIFDTILNGVKSVFNPEMMVYFMGITRFIASLLAVWMIGTFGRRTLMLVGNFVAFIFLTIIAVLSFMENTTTGVIMLICTC